MSAPDGLQIMRRALRIPQTDAYPLYLFTLKAQEVLRVADISRVSRDEAGKLIGYQRAEVRKHVQEITDYLNGESVIFPNPIIMALSPQVKFHAIRGNRRDGDELGISGTLTIPLPPDGRPKPAWIVDGQQRALALAKTRRCDFPIPVTAFIADTVSLQRDQFIRINNTRPLPRGLVTELLPAVDSPLAPRLAIRKAPSRLCDVLNNDERSPMHQMIKRASTSKDQASTAVIADTSVVDMITDSLTVPSGCLYPYRDLSRNETDFDAIIHALILYWSAVRDTFPRAWGQPPNTSRLMHGAGIRAMGRLMDRILGVVDARQPDAPEQVRKHLAVIAPHCHWTEPVWPGLGLIQNVPRHTQELSNHLIRVYLDARGGLR